MLDEKPTNNLDLIVGERGQLQVPGEDVWWTIPHPWIADKKEDFLSRDGYQQLFAFSIVVESSTRLWTSEKMLLTGKFYDIHNNDRLEGKAVLPDNQFITVLGSTAEPISSMKASVSRAKPRSNPHPFTLSPDQDIWVHRRIDWEKNYTWNMHADLPPGLYDAIAASVESGLDVHIEFEVDSPMLLRGTDWVDHKKGYIWAIRHVVEESFPDPMAKFRVVKIQWKTLAPSARSVPVVVDDPQPDPLDVVRAGVVEEQASIETIRVFIDKKFALITGLLAVLIVLQIVCSIF